MFFSNRNQGRDPFNQNFRKFLRMSTESDHFSRLICLGATKFVLLSVFTLIESICPRICSKSRTKSFKKYPLPVDVRRSKTSCLELRTPTSDGEGERTEKGEGIGERRNFFFPPPLPFLRMPLRLRDTWGCLFFSDKNSRPAFFSFWSHAPLQ